MLAWAFAMDPVTASFTVWRAVPAWLILLFVALASCCSLVTDVKTVARSVRVFARFVSVGVLAVLRLACAAPTLLAIDPSTVFPLSMAPDRRLEAKLHPESARYKPALGWY